MANPRVAAHLPLLVGEDKKKLSKRKHSVALGEFQTMGILPEAMVNYLALLGWGPNDDKEIRPVKEIAALFSLKDINKAPAYFDMKNSFIYQCRVHTSTFSRSILRDSHSIFSINWLGTHKS